MMRNGDNRGFTLVELLIVTAIMGLVMMAVFGVYQTTQRTTSTQDEVVEVQQNLRIAMEQIARDLRMAGFMVDPTVAPLTTATAGTVTFLNATAFGRAARIDVGLTMPDPSGTPNIAFTVSSSGMAELFAIGNTVRIVRPPSQGDMFGELTITGVAPTGPTITLTGFAGTDEGTDVLPGDVIARTAAGAFPNTVSYTRNGGDLHRLVNGEAAGDANIVASKLQDAAAGLAFSYILDDGTESATPGDLDAIVAVRVTITGDTTATPQGVKTRSLTNVVKLRN